MKIWRDSLYARLALAFLLAMLASFATMYLVFQNSLDRQDERRVATAVSAKVTVLEELIERRPGDRIPHIDGMFIAEKPTVVVPSGDDLAERASRLDQDISKELARPVQIKATTRPTLGFWIDLVPDDSPPSNDTKRKWLFFPNPRPVTHDQDSLIMVMAVGFIVFFAGGVYLIWQIQHPLERLSLALQSIGRNQALNQLNVRGGGIVATLSEHYNSMVVRLQQLEHERSVMLAGIAHDLRTPITRLRLLNELAQTNRRVEFERYLGDLDSIVEQFLAYVRGCKGESYEERDFVSFLEEVAAPYIAQGLQFKSDGTELLVDIKPNSLRRAFVNLLENAFEYGRPPFCLMISRHGDSVSVVVGDQGDGIPREDMDATLQPFTRLDSARGGRGHCGLGLVIARKIAEEHGGTLSLQEREGGGLEVLVSLPNRLALHGSGSE